MKNWLKIFVIIGAILSLSVWAETLEEEDKEYNGVINVVATVHVLPTKIKIFREHVEKIMPTVRKKSGNISYDFHQNLEQPTEFVFFETWNTPKSLQLHLDSQQMADFFQAVDDCLAKKPSIVKYRRHFKSLN